MSDDVGPRKRPARRSDPRALGRFIQELSWLLNTYEDLDFKRLAELAAGDAIPRSGSLFDQRQHRNTPAASLVGILPDLFTDESLFPTNEDIADFASQALGVVIPRWSKKSKYEIIGHVVCHTSVAGEERLERVVAALQGMTKNRETASKIITENKAKGISWNELIRQFLSQ